MIEIGGRPIFETGTERKTVRGEHFLDFVQGLAAEVRGLEQFVFRALDQVADVVDVFGLEAVGGTDRQFEVVDRIGSSGGVVSSSSSSTSSAVASPTMEPKTES